MGWASAGEIFDPVAQALVELDAPAEMKRAVLVKLIGKLRDGDWDTEEESLQAFRHDPAIVSAFYTALDGFELYGGGADGRIGFDADEAAWFAECRCGEVLGVCDAWLDDPPRSIAIHNGLLQLWAAHDRDRHDGSGKVPDWVLIGGAA